MYRHCPSCTRSLGTNEVLEAFPVGRRLAFDGSRGRLWVLCTHCRAWNLAPIETRWEAVEEAERAFEGAALGITSGEIALGRLREGTELIRIGGAAPVELAGWRYADRLRRRWRKQRLLGWGSGFAMAALAPSLGTAVGVAVGLSAMEWSLRRFGTRNVRIAAHPLEGSDGEKGEPLPRLLGVGSLRRLHLLTGEEIERLLESHTVHKARLGLPRDASGARDSPSPDWGLVCRPLRGAPLIIPPELRNRALRHALLELNKDSTRPKHVAPAMERLSTAGDSHRVMAEAARTLAAGQAWETHLGWPWGDLTRLGKADPVLRLAVEMAANEEVERLALEGELYRLELEWKEAEELAAISDSLLLPEWMPGRLRRLRREVEASEGREALEPSGEDAPDRPARTAGPDDVRRNE